MHSLHGRLYDPTRMERGERPCAAEQRSSAAEGWPGGSPRPEAATAGRLGFVHALLVRANHQHNHTKEAHR